MIYVGLLSGVVCFCVAMVVVVELRGVGSNHEAFLAALEHVRSEADQARQSVNAGWSRLDGFIATMHERERDDAEFWRTLLDSERAERAKLYDHLLSMTSREPVKAAVALRAPAPNGNGHHDVDDLPSRPVGYVDDFGDSVIPEGMG